MKKIVIDQDRKKKILNILFYYIFIYLGITLGTFILIFEIINISSLPFYYPIISILGISFWIFVGYQRRKIQYSRVIMKDDEIIIQVHLIPYLISRNIHLEYVSIDRCTYKIWSDVLIIHTKERDIIINFDKEQLSRFTDVLAEKEIVTTQVSEEFIPWSWFKRKKKK